MNIDKTFCNSILDALSDDYPGNMSTETYIKATVNHEDDQIISAHFKYLEEIGFIETEVSIDDERGIRSYFINPAKTKITSTGLDFLNDGGFVV